VKAHDAQADQCRVGPRVHATVVTSTRPPAWQCSNGAQRTHVPDLEVARAVATLVWGGRGGPLASRRAFAVGDQTAVGVNLATPQERLTDPR